MTRASDQIPTVVVLAAGIGRRFGGLKQLVPVGPKGEAILDYTIHDALGAGFGRVVLVIRKETEAEFREHLERTAVGMSGIELVHQALTDLPAGQAVPPGRSRPWGTGHAVLAAARALGDEPFAVANADDFYGPSAWTTLETALRGQPDVSGGSAAVWHMIGFRLGSTLPAAGAVSRALCRRSDDGCLQGLDEILEIWRKGDEGRWRDDSGRLRAAPSDSLVSMNLWGFTRELIPLLERGFDEFLASDPGLEREFLLPEAVGQAIRTGRARVRVTPAPESGSSAGWCGITSPEDLEVVRARLENMVACGLYPSPLRD